MSCESFRAHDTFVQLVMSVTREILCCYPTQYEDIKRAYDGLGMELGTVAMTLKSSTGLIILAMSINIYP